MSKKAVDVLIMTPLPEEMAALLSVLGPADQTHTNPIAHRAWLRANLGHGRHGRIVAFMPPDTDQVSAGESLRSALNTWEPRCVALVGSEEA